MWWFRKYITGDFWGHVRKSERERYEERIKQLEEIREDNKELIELCEELVAYIPKWVDDKWGYKDKIDRLKNEL